MDLVSALETDEGSGGTGSLSSPQVFLHFDIFTAQLNLLQCSLPLQAVFPTTQTTNYTIALRVPHTSLNAIPFYE